MRAACARSASEKDIDRVYERYIEVARAFCVAVEDGECMYEERCYEPTRGEAVCVRVARIPRRSEFAKLFRKVGGDLEELMKELERSGYLAVPTKTLLYEVLPLEKVRELVGKEIDVGRERIKELLELVEQGRARLSVAIVRRGWRVPRTAEIYGLYRPRSRGYEMLRAIAVVSGGDGTYRVYVTPDAVDEETYREMEGKVDIEVKLF